MVKSEFKANAVLIPADARYRDNDGDHVERDECTPLMLVPEWNGNSGPLYTREEWEADASPRLHRDGSRGECIGLNDGETVELLPDMVIVKIAERWGWSDEVKALTKEIWSCYAVNRREHHHLCSITPCYEAYYLGTQYDYIDELSDDEERREQLCEDITQGEAANETYSYFEVRDVERWIKEPIQQGFHPQVGKSGGYSIECDGYITNDCHLELRERFHASYL